MLTRKVERQAKSLRKPVWTTRGLAAVLMVILSVTIAHAQGRTAKVEFDIVADAKLAVTEHRRWYDLLTRLKVDTLRIHSATRAKTEIERTGGDYTVRAQLTESGSLLVPGDRFSFKDQTRLQGWLTDLRAGKLDSAGESDSRAFGLTAPTLLAVRAELARPVEFPTVELELSEALAKLSVGLDHPISLTKGTATAVAECDPASEDLKGLAIGTSAAYLLRSAGLAFAPRENAKQKIEFVAFEPNDDREVWPVGWKPEKKGSEVLPELYEISSVEIDDYPLAEVLAAISERVHAPLLYDHYGLVSQGIDLKSIKVTLPARQRNYANTLDKALAKGKAKWELRVDDAEKPFLWITTSKSTKRSDDRTDSSREETAR